MAFKMNRPVIKGTANHKASIAKAKAKARPVVSQSRTKGDASLVGAADALGKSYKPQAMDYSIDQKGIEFLDIKKEKKTKTVKNKEEIIKSLKISVREVNNEDISSRNLNKNTKGVVITNIENKSPLVSVLSVNDIIIEVQKNPVKNSSDLKNIVDGIFKKGEKTLLLTVIDKNNRRRYLGVKIN